MNEKKKLLMENYNYKILIVLACIQIFIFLCFSYGDVYITAAHGMSVWECLFSGKIREFYTLNQNTPVLIKGFSGEYKAGYDMFMYMIFAVWELPLWIISKVFGISNILGTFWGSIWARSITLFFTGVLVLVIQKIEVLLGKDIDEQKEILFMLATSPFLLTYVIIMGQYDVIVCVFMLIGIYYYLKGEMWKFLLFFSIAIPMKIFAILVFVPLVLYRCKNILKVLVSIVLAVIPMLIMRILIPMTEGGNITDFIDFIFHNTIALGNTAGGIPIFFVTMTLLCGWCYLQDTDLEEKEVFNGKVLYLFGVTYIIFTITCTILPYWFIYLLPPMYLIIMQNKRNFTANLVLSTVIEFSVVIAQIFRYTWCFSGTLVEHTLLSLFLERGRTGDYYTVQMLLRDKMGIIVADTICTYINVIGMAVCVGAIILFLILNNPWKKYSGDIEDSREVLVSFKCIRILLMVVIVLIPIIEYIY